MRRQRFISMTTRSKRSRQIEQFQAQLAPSEHEAVLGAFNELDLVAVCGLRGEVLEKVRHRADICSVYASPTRRGCGLARQLLGAAIAQCRANPDITVLSLNVNVDNTPAKSLYLALGFVSVGLQKNAMRVAGA
ncbi:ribosomal protein S18 acetylase RimI-like enzyme [Oxalobacteraceae bacterium GrIS 1.11]